MTDIFTKKSRWFDFANEHNKKAVSEAITLNGSQSYTFVAKHLAAGMSIPTSVRLDINRAKGVANHFSGLKDYHETGREVNNWIKRVAEECRRFAIENSINIDDFMRNVIKLTDKSVNETDAYWVDKQSKL